MVWDPSVSYVYVYIWIYQKCIWARVYVCLCVFIVGHDIKCISYCGLKFFRSLKNGNIV